MVLIQTLLSWIALSIETVPGLPKCIILCWQSSHLRWFRSTYVTDGSLLVVITNFSDNSAQRLSRAVFVESLESLEIASSSALSLSKLQ